MTKLPRDISGEKLARRLQKLGYSEERRHGSHVVLRTEQAGGHRCFLVMHKVIKPGTLEEVLKGIAVHHGLRLAELIRLLGL